MYKQFNNIRKRILIHSERERKRTAYGGEEIHKLSCIFKFKPPKPQNDGKTCIYTTVIFVNKLFFIVTYINIKLVQA